MQTFRRAERPVGFNKEIRPRVFTRYIHASIFTLFQKVKWNVAR